ncbi:MAG: hypothetical protein ACKOQ6_00835 [Bacteroidota bacterium]
MSNADNKGEPIDNLKAAMSSVIRDEKDMTVRPITKADSGPADKQVLVRTTEEERLRWKSAATADGKNLSTWIRDSLNERASQILDCQHPMAETRFYPWATICMKCGQRLWERSS